MKLPRTGMVAGMLVALAAGCRAPETPTPTSALGDDTITVASFDFDESAILAEVYGQALEQGGYRVERAIPTGPRELVQPALQRGLVEFVPEYLGTALEFLAGGQASADVERTHARLTRELADRGVAVLEPAPAQDSNGIAVTPAKAEELDLRTIEDLIPHAGELVLGGPPECSDRPLCLPGLERVYGLEFGSFEPLDASGPVTAAALSTGEVDVAVMFTTSGHLAGGRFVLLEDVRGLQPAENVVPVLHDATRRDVGPEVADLIDSVSALLTTEDLVELNRLVSLEGLEPAAAARDWLRSRWEPPPAGG